MVDVFLHLVIYFCHGPVLVYPYNSCRIPLFLLLAWLLSFLLYVLIANEVLDVVLHCSERRHFNVRLKVVHKSKVFLTKNHVGVCHSQLYAKVVISKQHNLVQQRLLYIYTHQIDSFGARVLRDQEIVAVRLLYFKHMLVNPRDLTHRQH